MNNAKRLLVSVFALAAFAGVGWGTYTLTGPSAPAEAASGHAGHDHGQKPAPADAHGYAEEHRTAAEAHDDHDNHDDHHAGGEESAEDLEDLFAGEKAVAAAPSKEEEHDDHGHAHRAAGAAPRKDPHAGHAHSRHAQAEGEICPEHNVPEAEDALCNSERVATLSPGEGLKVRLASPQVAGRIGVATARPLPAGEAGAAWSGQVVFNRDRQATLSALAAGTVQKVKVGLGDRVRKGDVLAEIAAPEAAGLRGEVAAADSRRTLAEAVYRREKDLLAKGITSRHEYEQAEAELRQAESALARARQQARDYGMAGSGSTLAIRAPFAGTVVERSAVAGEAVAAGTPLFTVADLSTLWIELSAPEDALLEVRPGQAVTASFAGLPGRAFEGKIFWVAPALDEKTRMLKALAALDNRDGVLRSGLFGEIRPTGRPVAGALAVPADALQSVDGQPFVFLRLADDLFELRRVAAGRKQNGTVTVAAGLDGSEQVVSAQAFALKSEVLRARLGASCADH